VLGADGARREIQVFLDFAAADRADDEYYAGLALRNALRFCST
jgi:hypothetical protein